MDRFANEISRHVWQTKYRFADPAMCKRSIADTCRRVARALAAVEPKNSETWEDRFFAILQSPVAAFKPAQEPRVMSRYSIAS